VRVAKRPKILFTAITGDWMRPSEEPQTSARQKTAEGALAGPRLQRARDTGAAQEGRRGKAAAEPQLKKRRRRCVLRLQDALAEEGGPLVGSDAVDLGHDIQARLSDFLRREGGNEPELAAGLDFRWSLIERPGNSEVGGLSYSEEDGGRDRPSVLDRD
jgi:hypothetical protein